MPEKSFIESMTNLQNAASEISKQSTDLEQSIKLYEEGIKEAEYCKSILDAAEQHISIYEKGE